ncbi:MAG: glycosyltransferase family 4 protein [Azospirillaceae bacterium]
MTDLTETPAARAGKHVVFVPHETLGGVGGIQRYDRRMIEGLAAVLGAAGGRASVSARVEPDSAYRAPDGVALEHADGSMARLALRVAHRARAGRADLVILGHAQLAPVGLMLRRLPGAPTVALCVHGDDVWSIEPGRRPHPVRRAAIRSCADLVFSVSRHTARRMREDYGLPAGRFRHLPNAIDTPGEAARDPVARPADRPPRLLTVSRMDPHDARKGIDVALEATARLVERHPGLTHVVVGDGPERPTYEAMAERLGLGGVARFTGRIDDAALNRLYAESDLFVLPSSKEGFGIVFLEAWRQGLPVVCGNRDASCEVVTDGADGRTVDPHDPAAVAEGVADILDRPDRGAALAAAGRRKIETVFSDAAFRRNLADLLDNRSGARVAA